MNREWTRIFPMANALPITVFRRSFGCASAALRPLRLCVSAFNSQRDFMMTRPPLALVPQVALGNALLREAALRVPGARREGGTGSGRVRRIGKTQRRRGGGAATKFWFENAISKKHAGFSGASFFWGKGGRRSAVPVQQTVCTPAVGAAQSGRSAAGGPANFGREKAQRAQKKKGTTNEHE